MKYIKPIIENDKMNNFFHFTFEKGEHAGESYEVFIRSACSSPTCSCSDMLFSVLTIGDTHSPAPEKDTRYEFCLDIKSKGFSTNHERDSSQLNTNFTKSFINELNDEDWELFNTFFFSYKTMLTETCDINDLNVKFDHVKIEEGLMIPYFQVFPYAHQFYIQQGEKSYIASDYYCLNSDCGCESVMISFDEIKNNIQILHKKESFIKFEYNSKSWEIDTPGIFTADEITDIVKTLLETYPDIAAVYKKRHKQLRKLYSKYKSKYKLKKISPTPTSQEKIGRNDPCPCGSGKKFKKCCGNAYTS
jgi:hypothetical protein